MEPYSIKLPAETKLRLRQRAEKARRTPSDMARLLIEDGLRSLEEGGR